MSKEEIAKRVAAHNDNKKGGGRPRKVNPKPNRVDSEFMDPLRETALDKWAPALLALNKVWIDAINAVNDPDMNNKQRREIITVATSFSPLVKHLSQFASGAIHPTGHNTISERELAAERVAFARQGFAEQEAKVREALIHKKGQPKPV